MTGSVDQIYRRNRGVLLTPQAHARLQAARAKLEYEENGGKRLSYQALGDRTQLSIDTVKKIFDNKKRVDLESLRLCFQALNLTLEEHYYVYPDLVEEGASYVERYPSESICYEELLKQGSLVRLRAPRQMGKSSLMNQVLARLRNRDHYWTVYLTFKEIVSRKDLSSLDRFLRCLCRSVGKALELPDQIELFWDEEGMGSKVSCSTYFEEYFLDQTQTPLVLCLDDVDLLFSYPEISEDFFGLLRAWFEKAKSRVSWKKLRLALVHSTEVYIHLNINQSPFNVGLPIELEDLSCEQGLRLAHLNQLDVKGSQFGEDGIEPLMKLVGGHPYLLTMAFSHLHRHPELSLAELIAKAPTVAGIYSDHLRGHWIALQNKPDIAAEFKHVVQSKSPIQLNPINAHQLHGMGLIKLVGNCATVQNELYRSYFSKQG